MSDDQDPNLVNNPHQPPRGVPYQEYPKMLPDGRIVQSAEEEHGAPTLEPDAPEKPNPLDDVSIEMDNPAFDAPKRKTATKKK